MECDFPSPNFVCNEQTTLVLSGIFLIALIVCAVVYNDQVIAAKTAKDTFEFVDCPVLIQETILKPMFRVATNITHIRKCKQYIGMPETLIIGSPPVVNDLLWVPMILLSLALAFCAYILCRR